MSFGTKVLGQRANPAWANAVEAALGSGNPVCGANYTIFNDGGTYKARNNLDGTLPSGGTSSDADVAFQYCHDQLTSGGLIRVMKGNYTFADTVVISNEAIYIVGAGTGYDTLGTEVTLGSGVNNKPVFKYANTTHKFFGGIADLAIDGNDNAGSIGVHIEKFYSDLWIQRCWIKYCAAAGVKVEGNVGGAASGSKQWNLWFLDNLIENCKTGDAYLFTNADSTTEKIDRVTIRGGHYYDNNNTIKCDAEFVFHVIVTGLTVEQEQQHSINLTGARHWNIYGNHIFDCGTDAANTYDGIYIGGVGGSPPIGIQIFGNSLDNTWTNNQKYGIELDGDCDHIRIFGNMLDGGGATGNYTNASSGTDIRIYDQSGYITENSGSSTITNPATSQVVAHGLDVTPSAEHITIIGKENPTADVGTIWVDTIGAANFTVNVEVAPGASHWDFGWHVRVY